MSWSGYLFNATMENWLESLLCAMLSPLKSASERIIRDDRRELSLLCHSWMDHYLSPYRNYPPAAAEHALMTVSDMVVLGRVGHDVDLWDKILGLTSIVSDELRESGEHGKAMELITLVGLRLRAVENRCRPGCGVVVATELDFDPRTLDDQVA